MRLSSLDWLHEPQVRGGHVDPASPCQSHLRRHEALRVPTRSRRLGAGTRRASCLRRCDWHGEAAVEVVRAGSASELSSLEPEAAERETVLAYLGGARSPVALGLSGVVRYEKPKSLLEIGVAHAPQSYQFVEDPWDTSRS